MTIIDVTRLANDSDRAAFLADHVGDPEAALGILSDSIDAYLATIGEDRLPETLCGPVMATVGACMVGSLYGRFTAGPNGDEWDGDPIELLMKGSMTAQTIEHAAYDHGDPFALRMRETGTLSETYDAIVEWVTEVLWASADLDPVLVSLDGWDDDDDDDAA